MRHDINMYAIDANSNENPEPVKFWKGYREMFSDGELCKCEHYKSLDSLAAYFTDILNFIKRKDENEEAFIELIRRRPDLDDIKLVFKNTNTLLPYIDLLDES